MVHAKKRGLQNSREGWGVHLSNFQIWNLKFLHFCSFFISVDTTWYNEQFQTDFFCSSRHILMLQCSLTTENCWALQFSVYLIRTDGHFSSNFSLILDKESSIFLFKTDGQFSFEIWGNGRVILNLDTQFAFFFVGVWAFKLVGIWAHKMQKNIGR